MRTSFTTKSVAFLGFKPTNGLYSTILQMTYSLSIVQQHSVKLGMVSGIFWNHFNDARHKALSGLGLVVDSY